MASNVASEGTAAAENKIGELRRDPFAMLPFCGYNMGDYFGHWLNDGRARPTPPSCRASTSSTGSARTSTASSSGRAIGENSRVLKWIVERLDGKAEAVDTPIGRLPARAPGRLGPGPDRRSSSTCCSTVDPTSGREEAALIPGLLRTFRRPPAAGAVGRAPGPVATPERPAGRARPPATPPPPPRNRARRLFRSSIVTDVAARG